MLVLLYVRYIFIFQFFDLTLQILEKIQVFKSFLVFLDGTQFFLNLFILFQKKFVLRL